MVRFNDKPQILASSLTGDDIIPITDIDDDASDKKVSVSQLNTYFGNNIETFALKDLANTGMLADAIISAPNGVMVANTDNDTIIVKNGLKVLFSNGRTADKRFDTIEYTVESDISQNVSTLADDTYELFINSSGSLIYTPLDNVKIARNIPVVTTTVAYWYDIISNYWKYTSNSGTTWSNITVNALGQFTILNGAITNITQNTVAYIPNPEAIMVRDLSNITKSGEESIKDLMSYKQNSTDDSLTTTANTVVGAINELNSLKALDTEVVHLSDDETITGDKTFSGDTTLSGGTNITGNISSSGANTFSGNNTFSGTNTFSNAVTFSGSVTLPSNMGTVKEYSSGTDSSGYIVFSNNICIQWGIYDGVIGNQVQHEITLMKNYNNQYWNVQVTGFNGTYILGATISANNKFKHVARYFDDDTGGATTTGKVKWLTIGQIS